MNRENHLKQQLSVLGEQLCCLYMNEDTNTLGSMMHLTKGRKLTFPKSCFEEVLWMPFENVEMPVPVDYETVLNKKYREWQKPRRGSQNHDYPYYRKQEELLRNYLKQSGVSGERFYLE